MVGAAENPGQPGGTTCISIREVMVGSHVLGEQPREARPKPYSSTIQPVQPRSHYQSRPFATPTAKSPMGQSAPASATDPAAALKALDGSWSVVRVEKGKEADSAWARILGNNFGSEGISSASRFDFKDGVLAVLSFEKAACWASLYSINPLASPHEIDLLNGTQRAPPLAVGVYEIDGDRLKICLRRYDSSVPRRTATGAPLQSQPDSGTSCSPSNALRLQPMKKCSRSANGSLSAKSKAASLSQKKHCERESTTSWDRT